MSELKDLEQKLQQFLDDLNKNSMLYWFPKIKDLGIPMPRTFLVVVKENLLECLDNPDKFPKTFHERV
jgi:hypothetical protein